MSTTIEDRVILLLRDQSGDRKEEGNTDSPIATLKSFFSPPKRELSGHGFWENLERYTGISSQRWRKAYTRRQRPTPDMIEAIGQMFPEYAFWLITGVTDGVNGHIAPPTAQTFPERMYANSYSSHQYFAAEISLFRKLFKEGRVNLGDDKERLASAERTRPMAHWWDSPLCEAAYQIANSEEYEEIKKIAEEREIERKTRVLYITTPNERPWIKQNEKLKDRGLKSVPFLGIDPRTKHQDHWDLYYSPIEKKNTKFALSVLNIPPAELSDEDINELTQLSFNEIEKYLEHHGVNSKVVFPPKGGSIRFSELGISAEEMTRFKNEVTSLRKKKGDNKSS